MAETTETKRPRTSNIMILEQVPYRLNGNSPPEEAHKVVASGLKSRRAALDAIAARASGSTYQVVAVLWAGRCEVETKAVATLKPHQPATKRPRGKKPSAYAKAEALLDNAAAQGQGQPVGAGVAP